MQKSLKLVIVVIVIIFGLIFAWNIIRYFLKQIAVANYRPPAQVVTAEKVSQQPWHPSLRTIGTLDAVNGVTVSSQQAGVVVQINFSSGQNVKQGDLLVVIDNSVEQAQLQNAIAKVNLAQITLQRNRTLMASRAVSAEAFDQAKSSFDQAVAEKNQVQAVINQKNIRAPFSGKIGINQINVGQYISPGQAIASLQELDTLYVEFSLPEQYLHQLHLSQQLTITTAAVPGKSFTGKITAINSTVDPQTHNLAIEGTIPNPSLQLYPGLFVTVSVNLPTRSKVIVVPQTAVTFSLFGSTVYQVYKDGKDNKGNDILRVRHVAVTVGEQQDDKVVIEKGLKPGDVIVTTGQVKLEDGMQVVISNNPKERGA